MIERLEGIYELGEEMIAETSHDALYDKVRRDVFERLLADGVGVEEAEHVIEQSVDELLAIVADMVSTSHKNMQAVVGLGDKLMQTCRPEGVQLTHSVPREYICMSALAINLSSNAE